MYSFINKKIKKGKKRIVPKIVYLITSFDKYIELTFMLKIDNLKGKNLK